MSITAMASRAVSGTKDTVTESIRTGSIGARNISYPLIRGIAGRDHNCWSELDRGRAILTSIEQLDQYLFSYGPMTKGQWDQVLPSVHIPSGRVQIVDYGCGQGLASALLFDHFGSELVMRTTKMILVERSRVALTRAESILRCYAPRADVRSFYKCIDDLTVNDLRPDGENIFVHLFSNVLDMDSFDHIDLFAKILKTKGSHTFLCVSHNRDFCGGSKRFRQIASILNNSPDQKKRFTMQSVTLREFRCPHKGHASISMQLRVEVHHGSF